MKKGQLITFEGLDFSGKTTQLKLFYDYLTQGGIDVKIYREPGGTSLAEAIRNILLHKKSYNMSKETEFALFLGARAELYKDEIKPRLENGVSCITDRCGDSSVAYQGFGRFYGDENEVKYIIDSNKRAMQGVNIDITYFIDIPVAVAMKRKNDKLTSGKEIDRMESNNYEFFERVREGYLWLSKKEPRFRIIDGIKSIEEIHSEIIDAYNDYKNSN